jgi:drug/metabolite transporter (DMT)-like permease
MTPGGHDLTRGLLLGTAGVAMFALTLPMTRLAVGDAAAPQLPPAFVTAGRAAVAGLLSLLYLWVVRAPRPARRHAPALLVSGLGTVLGFPLCLAMALREVPSAHAAVVSGAIPLATALVAAWSLRQQPSAGFWACALAGFGLVLGYAAWQGGGRLVAADAWLLGAVLSTAFGYVAGARVSAQLPAAQVIGWILVFSLPLTLPAAMWLWPAETARVPAVRPSAWLGFAYVSVFSMWLGFFAWYRGLALGGVVRVSQVQLLQPFLAIVFAVPLLGEPLEPAAVGCALAVIGIVLLSRRTAVRAGSGPGGRPAARHGPPGTPPGRASTPPRPSP